jgi:hypothetical protein
MKIKELIDELKKYPDDIEVVVEDWETGGLMPLTEKPEQRSKVWVPGSTTHNNTVLVLK